MTTTTKPHHYFHTEGLTDLGKLREEAIAHARQGERVVLHLHEYEEEYDGCTESNLSGVIDLSTGKHETFEESA